MADLYIAPVPAGSMESLFPPQRQAQLEATKDQDHRLQRYGVWKLLEYALSQSLGLELRRLQLTLDSRGRWSCPECFFSLAHTDGAVAVAVSRFPIGVDLERLDRPVKPGVARKLLSDREQEVFSSLAEPEKNTYLLEKWCIYESLFKWREAAGDGQPKVVCSTAEGYCYAVATNDPHLQLTILQEEAPWN